MPEIVFQVVALGFEHVVVLIFDLAQDPVGRQEIHHVVQSGVRIGLTYQNEVQLLAFQLLAKRLAAEQIVSQEGHSLFGIEVPVGLYPPFAGFNFTILFLLPILGRNKLWFQSNDMLISWLDDHGGQYTVKVIRRSIREFSLTTLLAVDLLR